MFVVRAEFLRPDGVTKEDRFLCIAPKDKSDVWAWEGPETKNAYKFEFADSAWACVACKLTKNPFAWVDSRFENEKILSISLISA